jgi:hypothetical protein
MLRLPLNPEHYSSFFKSNHRIARNAWNRLSSLSTLVLKDSERLVTSRTGAALGRLPVPAAQHKVLDIHQLMLVAHSNLLRILQSRLQFFSELA